MLLKSEGETINILLVEDDEVDVMNVKRAFASNEIDNPILHAENGLEALKMLKDNDLPHPKIVLLDINMPKMNGIEFLQEVRNDPDLRSLIIFIMTTSDESSDRTQAYNFNVAGYIIKPQKFDHFVNVVKHLKNYWQTIAFN